MARIRGPQDLPGKIEGDTFLTPKYEQKDPSPRFRGPQDLVPIPKAKDLRQEPGPYRRQGKMPLQPLWYAVLAEAYLYIS